MTFDTLTVARSLIPLLRGPVEKIAARDGDLAKQIRKAANSVPLNVGEGRERGGRDRGHGYRIALGSVSEVREALGVAFGWGYLRETDVADALVAIDRLRAMLWRLTH
jgi:four helix bundle protein